MSEVVLVHQERVDHISNQEDLGREGGKDKGT